MNHEEQLTQGGESPCATPNMQCNAPVKIGEPTATVRTAQSVASNAAPKGPIPSGAPQEWYSVHGFSFATPEERLAAVTGHHLWSMFIEYYARQIGGQFDIADYSDRELFEFYIEGAFTEDQRSADQREKDAVRIAELEAKLKVAIEALDNMRFICTCNRPTESLNGGGVRAPGPHTANCVKFKATAALQQITESFHE